MGNRSVHLLEFIQSNDEKEEAASALNSNEVVSSRQNNVHCTRQDKYLSMNPVESVVCYAFRFVPSRSSFTTWSP